MLRRLSLLLVLTGSTLVPSARAELVGPAVIDCAGKPVLKPDSIQIGCATGSVMISDITWTSWTANEARGRGTLVVNSCTVVGGPTCVEGISTRYPAQISLGRQASGPGLTVFSKVNLRFADGGPAALSSGSYILDRPIKP